MLGALSDPSASDGEKFLAGLDALSRLLLAGSEWGGYASAVPRRGGARAAAREAAEEAGERLARQGAKQEARSSFASRLQRLASFVTAEVESYRTFRYLKQTHPDAFVELYHYTGGKAAQEIMASGFLRGGRGLWRPWASKDVYFSVCPNAPGWLLRGVYMLEPAKTQVVIPVRVPLKRVPLKEVIWRPFGIRIVPGPVPFAAGY